jgi:hypothetical protein
MFRSSRGSAALVLIALVGAAFAAALGIATGGARQGDQAGPVLSVTITPESKTGPDGRRHDAYSQTDFAVQAGRALTLRINNTDGQPHSIVSATAHVAIIAAPGVHDYTLLVKRPGRFHWRCFFSCDSGAGGWAMTHAGYMSGYVTAT